MLYTTDPMIPRVLHDALRRFTGLQAGIAYVAYMVAFCIAVASIHIG